NTAITAPSGMTQRFHAENSSDAASESADASQAAPGATGSTAANNAQISQLIALAPGPSCPADTVKAAGTGCTDDGNPCTTDVCNGTVGAPACLHNPGNAGTVCRAAAAGGGDVAETSGASSTTRAAAVQPPATLVRRAAADGCL